MKEQVSGRIERLSVPAAVIGRARLASGQSVPMLWPDLRGMYSWSAAALARALSRPQGRGKEAAPAEGLEGFLERIYHGLRNLGLSSPDRAVNYAATNALNAAQVFTAAAKDRMQLDDIAVERSPLCRPESDCWDVNLIFFDPEHQMQRARKVYRFTVDVSDICPVMVGPVRSWSIR
jgi:cyanobactin maturation PatA/PatG family protease